MFPIWISLVLIYLWVTSRNKWKKHSVTKKFSDLLLFSENLQKNVSVTRTFFFLTVRRNNFGNQIPLHFWLFLHGSESQNFFPIWILIVLIFSKPPIHQFKVLHKSRWFKNILTLLYHFEGFERHFSVL